MLKFIPENYAFDENDEETMANFNSTVDFMSIDRTHRRWNDWRYMHRKSRNLSLLMTKLQASHRMLI